MIRIFYDQHYPFHSPQSTSSRMLSYTSVPSSSRRYHSITGVSTDQDMQQQQQSSSQLQDTVAPQSKESSEGQSFITSFLAPPGTERHYNPYETIADSFKNKPSESSEKLLLLFDPTIPKRMMNDAVNSRNPQQIWHTYTRLTRKTVDLDNPPFSPAIYFRMLHCFQATKSKQTAEWALAIYEDMKKYHQPKIATLNTMLDILIRFENIDWAINFFRKDSSILNLSPNIRSYNIMIRGLAANGQLKEAERIYSDMRSGAIPEKPQVSTYSTLMSHYIKNGMHSEADGVLDDMLKDNVKPNMWIFNSVVKRFVQRKDYTAARRAITLMRESDLEPDVVTYSTLIDGYARDGNEGAIADIQSEMARNKVYPNEKTITSTIKVFSRSNLDAEIDSRLEMVLKSLPPGEMNELTFGVLMNVYGKRKDMDAAMGIYYHIISKGREANDVIICSLLDGYVRSNDLPTANKIFHDHYTARGVQPPSSWSYSILITGCCKTSNLHDALHYYHEMNNYQIDPDVTICSRLIQLYLEHHQPESARHMLLLMRNTRMEVSVHTYTMMIDYMSSIKNIRSALRYYQEMLDAGIQPDVHCYTVLINAHIRSDNYAACDTTFEQMVKAGIQPSLETLTSMLHAHSLQGNIDRVRSFWAAITDMGLLPDIKSFTLLMQTYSQQGNIEMVEFIFKEITRKELKVDAIMLMTLISAYSNLPTLNVRRIDEISHIMEELELEPTPGYFTMILDTFGRHGMPDRVVKTWGQTQGLETPLDWTPSTTNLLYLIEACRDRGYIETLQSVWRAATFGINHRSKAVTDADSLDPSSTLSPLPRVNMMKPMPEVFTAYLNALLTHNRFQEIENLLGEGCQQMRMVPRNEDFELLFTGLAQYDFLKKELASIRQIVVERWPRVESFVDRIILNTRKI
ncbi:hypothetical protein BGX27_001192 [Mortierella sp. AM989]|nr:hypothetical protein BGX27_001192 [Mortierella sp. AM989]